MKEKKGNVLLFDKQKYRWLIIGLLVTAIGFILMIGGSSDDPEVFSDAIFSFRRMTLAPILVLAGYGIQIYAIMKKTTNLPESSPGTGAMPKKETQQAKQPQKHKTHKKQTKKGSR